MKAQRTCLRLPPALAWCLAWLVPVPAFAAEAQTQEQGHEHQHGAAAEPDASIIAVPADGTSAREHVAPDAPQTSMGDMSRHEMAAAMGMDDAAGMGHVLFDEAGWREVDSTDAIAWDGWAWYGSDYTRLWLRSEGTHSDAGSEARTELLVDRIVARWWSLQAGLRHDSGDGPSRDWFAVGLQGLAPGFLETQLAAYIGEDGRTALRLKTEYDLLLTQRMVLQPLLELELYGKDDTARGIASGFSSGELGFRLRYEIRRELAPYIGLVYARKFAGTADLARQAGEDPAQWQWAAGLRFWF